MPLRRSLMDELRALRLLRWRSHLPDATGEEATTTLTQGGQPYLHRPRRRAGHRLMRQTQMPQHSLDRHGVEDHRQNLRRPPQGQRRISVKNTRCTSSAHSILSGWERRRSTRLLLAAGSSAAAFAFDAAHARRSSVVSVASSSA